MNSVSMRKYGAGFALMLAGLSGCVSATPGNGGTDDPYPKADELVAGAFGDLGAIAPAQTSAWEATFERGKAVAMRRFDIADGLGPSYNVVSCASCHERPTAGGGSALYRNFPLMAIERNDGSFSFAEVTNKMGGVVPMYSYGPVILDDPTGENDDAFRPTVPEAVNIVAQRNCDATYGVGLIAELGDEVILANADPDDADGDGISGRPNYESGLIGRFGRKAQTTSIEGFIRGPLHNHLGITTDPLSDERRADLPVDSTLAETSSATRAILSKEVALTLQAVATSEPTTDADPLVDPEMSEDDLFDLVAFTMLLAAPDAEDITHNETALRGRRLFHQISCTACHIPALEGPRGKVPLYSDLLIHDMGDDLADGIRQGEATGSEFRTHPLWGIGAAVGHLHDGRAETLRQATLLHGGEAETSRDEFEALPEADKLAIEEFMSSLGGRDQVSTGLLPPNAPVPATGEYGGPRRNLSSAERAQFISGREVFDRDFGYESGVGTPGYNGDSCRACHFDPVIGGAGPRDVNVIRQGIVDSEGHFSEPPGGTMLHKEVATPNTIILPAEGVNFFEHRQTPHAFGLGLIQSIPEAEILDKVDPDDADGDGVSGRASYTDDGRLGRLGWKAQAPNIGEFIRDAMGAEIGLTVEEQTGLSFGITTDGDSVADPELTRAEAEDMAFFLAMLAPPPRQPIEDAALVDQGEELFDSTGCTKCHTPTMTAVFDDGSTQDAHLYSDLLLHEIMADDAIGVDGAAANGREFRTAPLWGLSKTAPYFHTGLADTIEEAIDMHEGEAESVHDAYEDLSTQEKEALLAFLETL